MNSMDVTWHLATEIPEDRREAAERKLEKLAKDHRDLISLTVHVEGSEHHQRGTAEARIHCHAKGKELVASERDEEPAKALARAIEAFEREVHKMRDKRRDRRS